MSASVGRRDPFVGLVLDGKYEVVSLLARGGMGRVYRAIQRPLGREVALKVLDLEQLDAKAKSADFARRFFLEAAACAKLNHPNTVVVFDYGQAGEDVFYIAMELLDGRTLDQALDVEAPLDPARVKHIALQICGSIGEAHERGMIHRDLKPSNVMLNTRGADPDFVKVLDFGLVKNDDDAGLTQSGALLGTPRYIAPEQIGSSDVGPESDVYSLGACLYHCLTGRPPFESDSKFVLLASHMNVDPPAIHEVFPESPASPELAAIVMRCLRKDPAMRYRSMTELVEALLDTPEPLLSGRSSLPTSSSPGLSGNGLSGNGLSGNGLSGNGLSGNGLSSSGASRPGFSRPPSRSSELERSGVKRSSNDVLATSVERPHSEVSMALANTALANTSLANPSLANISLATDPRRAVPFTLIAILVGALGVVGGWWLLREPPAPTVTELPRAVTPLPTPVAPVVATTPVEPVVDSVRLLVEPSGARIRRGELTLGDAPLTLPIPAGESWSLRVEAEGFVSRDVTVMAGQGEVRVSLERSPTTTGRRPPRNVAPEPPPTVEPPPEPRVEPPPAMREPAVRTDNRDPWAR